MTTLTPQQQAEYELKALDVLDQAIEMVYGRLTHGRPRLSLQALIDCQALEPQFEYRLEVPYKMRQRFPRLHLPHNYWFYTVKGVVKGELVLGGLIGGDLMVVEAIDRERADVLAGKGLQETLTIAKDLRDAALAMPGVTIENPDDAIDLVSAGRKAHQGAPMGGAMREKLGLMMTDRIAESRPKFQGRQFRRKPH